MENLLNKGSPSRIPGASLLDLFNNRLNKTQVIRGAIFDLLTSQCDRHAQNIFINEQVSSGSLRSVQSARAAATRTFTHPITRPLTRPHPSLFALHTRASSS